MWNLLRLRSLPRTFAALVMLVTLLLGAAGHAWHHYVDHDCERHTGASQAPCGVCAGMHAAQLQGDVAAARVPVPVLLGTVVFPRFEAPETAQPRAAGARAPPAV
jgi:hypothetical protein